MTDPVRITITGGDHNARRRVRKTLGWHLAASLLSDWPDHPHTVASLQPDPGYGRNPLEVIARAFSDCGRQAVIITTGSPDEPQETL